MGLGWREGLYRECCYCVDRSSRPKPVRIVGLCYDRTEGFRTKARGPTLGHEPLKPRTLNPKPFNDRIVES